MNNNPPVLDINPALNLEQPLGRIHTEANLMFFAIEQGHGNRVLPI
jgi:hypothetical protein